MTKSTKAALAVAALSVLAGPAFADNLGYISPETVEASVHGSTEMIIHVPQGGERAMTVAPIDVTNSQQVSVIPGSGQRLDMSGSDGSLRSCYANGGIAKQGQDLGYFCEFDVASSTVATSSPYITAPEADTGYSGTNDVADPALLDCVSRGGSLIQLSANGQFACAM